MSFPPAIVYQQTQWEGPANNFAVLCKINSRWQVKIGNYNPTMTTDENAANVANTGSIVPSNKAAEVFPDFNFKAVSYLDAIPGQNVLL
jgi:hypothetical protein